MHAATAPIPDDRLTSSFSPGLRGDVTAPGDKSISHRALILGGLARGETVIEGLLEADDILATAQAVQAFGASVERDADGLWKVRGCTWVSPSSAIDCGNSGTGVRLLMGAAAGLKLEATFTGDESLRGRPMARVLDPLRAMGAEADSDRLPVTLRGGALRGISFTNALASAQVKSAILLAGLHADGEVEVVEPAPSRDHTENMLRAFGCEVLREGPSIRLGNERRLTGTSVSIPGDPSSAAFPIVAALIAPESDLLVRGVMLNRRRAGFVDTLQEMGAGLELVNERTSGGERVADIRARTSLLHGVEVGAGRAPSMIDEYPILAVAAAFARGRSVFHGLAELKVKESDRLAAIIGGLRACGVDAEAVGDSLHIVGTGDCVPGGASIAAHHDHRIAMSFLVLGLASKEPVEVDSARMIATSFPNFLPLMRSLGAAIA